ncbi:MAG: DUF402 domain-containing protein [Alphaproteobacteria bacterium]|nr:DUF402 domain-containing protein [Alphaproteobacteria bacterium]
MKTVEIVKSPDHTPREYDCKLELRSDGFAVLSTAIKESWRVGTLNLLPGDRSFGLYWLDRDYNLYIWRRDGVEIGWYYNVLEDVSLSGLPAELVWTDWYVDVFYDQPGNCLELDWDEVPGWTPPERLDWLKATVARIKQDHPSNIEFWKAEIGPRMSPGSL